MFATRELPHPRVDGICLALIGPRPFLRFFTDGSCRHPNTPDASHAGFAVILDTSPSDECVPGILANWRASGVPPHELRVVCQGLVPGLQSINRAELCAVIQAVRLCVSFGASEAEIWTDSAFVIREWDSAVHEQPGIWPDLAAVLRRLPPDRVRLRKVASHQDVFQLWGMDQWLAAGNEAADVAAKAAVGRELSCVSEAADTAHDYLVRQRALLQSFWKYLLRSFRKRCDYFGKWHKLGHTLRYSPLPCNLVPSGWS